MDPARDRERLDALEAEAKAHKSAIARHRRRLRAAKHEAEQLRKLYAEHGIPLKFSGEDGEHHGRIPARSRHTRSS